MAEREQSKLKGAYETFKKLGVAVGVGLIAVGTIFGFPGLAAAATQGMMIDLGVVDPNIKAGGQTYEQWKKRRSKGKK